MTITVTALDTYRNEKPYPFCPGCGHGPILDRLDEALVSLALDPAKVVVVSDIGCSGLSDQYFATSAFHGLHGRSITYATGIKVASPELTVVVVMGDGGTGIGGAHLLGAARRNIGITVLVMNNFNFGMTGGQHSTTTPEGSVTATTPGGNLEHPLDICATVAVNGAGFAYRGTSFDDDLAQRIAEAISHPGFALLDIWELCTAYYVPNNRFTRRGLEESMSDLGFVRGVVARTDRAEYASAYGDARVGVVGTPIGVSPRPIEVSHGHVLDGPVSLLIAGSAGAKVRSTARIVAEAAVSCGLWVTQKDDYPVTVKTGHSLSLLSLSPAQEPLTPVTAPDAAVIVSADGLARARAVVERMRPDGRVLIAGGLEQPSTSASTRTIESPPASDVGKSGRALFLSAASLTALGWFDLDALRSVAGRGPYGEASLRAVEAGIRACAKSAS